MRTVPMAVSKLFRRLIASVIANNLMKNLVKIFSCLGLVWAMAPLWGTQTPSSKRRLKKKKTKAYRRCWSRVPNHWAARLQSLKSLVSTVPSKPNTKKSFQ